MPGPTSQPPLPSSSFASSSSSSSSTPASTSASSSSPPHRPLAPPLTSASSWRRFSNPPLPTLPALPALPNIPHLRAALLGYIHEAESALRASSPSPSPSPGEAWSSATSPATNGGVAGLRNRTGLSLSDPASHLATLREDVWAYLPSLPVGTPSREWLRALPSRLHAVDLSVSVSGEVDAARQRVIELVHALLPSEEWAGWERLGWEEQEKGSVSNARSRRHSVSVSPPSSLMGDGEEEEEEEEEEPEYLFPNKTPAAAQIRRRPVRSKSLGSHGLGLPAGFFAVDAVRGDKRGLLKRTMTEPIPRRDLPDDEEEEEEGDGVVAVGQGEEDEALVVDKEVGYREQGPTLAEALQKSEDGRALIGYEDLPFVWRNNEHIFTGYRFIPLQAKTGPIPLIKSAFKWHNETINIHSHFLPTLFILVFILTICYASPLSSPHVLDTLVLIAYLLAACSCLITSAGWHVLSGCASKRWFEWGACVDYVGISWLIAASFLTVLYDAYHCHPRTVLLYSMTNGLCGVLGSYLPFQRWFNERRNKNWRITFFLGMCFVMVFPMAQMFWEYGYSRASAFVAPFGLSIMAYVTGLIFYAFHFPECVWPGRFDYYGASHQIWHACIVLAIILHYRAIFAAHDKRFEYSCSIPGAGEPVGVVVEGMIRAMLGR